MKISTLLLFVIALLAISNHGYVQAGADKILGIYRSPKKDIGNPDKQLRERDILGVDLLKNFDYEEGVYSGGEVYDPANGKTYSCKISFTGFNLKVRGYIGISLFGRTELFERIK